MRRKILALLCLAALAIAPVHAEGETLLRYQPPALALTAGAETAVELEQTALTFSFSEGEMDELGLAPQAELEARYTLTNPTDQTLTVEVAVPYVDAAENGNAGAPSVTVDDQPAEGQLHYGGPVTGDEDLAILEDPEQVSQLIHAVPTEMADGTMYTFIPVVDVERFLREETQIRFYVRAKFRYDGPLVYGGFGGISQLEDGMTELTAWIYPEREEWPLLTVFLPGGGTLEECTVNGYDDYIGIRTPLGVEMTMDSAQGVTFRDYVDQYLEEPTGREVDLMLRDMALTPEGIPIQQVQEVSELLTYAMDYDRLILEVFPVEFAPGQTRQVTVTGSVDPTVWRTQEGEQVRDTATYRWQSGPTAAWAGVGGVSVHVVRPEEMEQELLMDAEEGTQESTPEEISFSLADPLPETGRQLPMPLILGAGAAGVVLAALLLAVLLRRK